MAKSDIIIIIYVLGIIAGALIIGVWDAKTSLKSLLGITWTTIFLIALFYVEKENHN